MQLSTPADTPQDELGRDSYSPYTEPEPVPLMRPDYDNERQGN